MKLSRLKLLFGASATALLALLSAGPAYAGAYAISLMKTTDFQICDLTSVVTGGAGIAGTVGAAGCAKDGGGGYGTLSTAGSKLTAANIASANFSDSGNTSASLNGTPATPIPTGDNSGVTIITNGVVGVSDVTVNPGLACIGSGCGAITADSFVQNTVVPPNPTTQYAMADANQFGSAVGGLPAATPTGAQNASILTQAESALPGNGLTGGSGQLSTSTNNFSLKLAGGFDCSGVLGAGATTCRLLALQFSTSLLVQAYLDNASAVGSLAQANSFFSFNLTSTLGNITWSPNGTSGDAVAGLVLGEQDPFNLQQTAFVTPGSSPNPQTFSSSGDYTIWALVPTGVTFNGNFTQTSQLNITRVPEPGTIALLGLALTGLAFLQRRRNMGC